MGNSSAWEFLNSNIIMFKKLILDKRVLRKKQTEKLEREIGVLTMIGLSKIAEYSK